MALHILNLVTLFTIFLFMIIALKIRKHYIKSFSSTKKIPLGPWKLPIIGNIQNLVTTNPPRKLRDLAKIYGPLMHLQLGEQLIYNSTDIAFSPYGDYWRQLRKICAIELLSSKRVKSLWPIRENEISSLLKNIASNEGSEFNLTQAVNSMMYTFTSKAAFGKKYLEQEEFISAVKQCIKLAGGFYIGDLFPSAKWIQNLSGMRPKLEKLSQQLDRILENIINDHKEIRSRRAKEGLAEAEEDLIDCLLKFEDSDSDMYFHLTRDNIKAIIQDVFTGGSDTAATTIIWAMAEMLKDPRVLKKAQAEVLALLLYHFDWRLPNGMKNEELELIEESGATMSRKGDLYLIPTASNQFLVI
ncbi:cytochrome P450 71D11 [Trifolium repens]|nr:cytochrome P450 71D11 [Trifolium repens]